MEAMLSAGERFNASKRSKRDHNDKHAARVKVLQSHLRPLAGVNPKQEMSVCPATFQGRSGSLREWVVVSRDTVLLLATRNVPQGGSAGYCRRSTSRAPSVATQLALTSQPTRTQTATLQPQAPGFCHTHLTRLVKHTTAEHPTPNTASWQLTPIKKPLCMCVRCFFVHVHAHDPLPPTL